MIKSESQMQWNGIPFRASRQKDNFFSEKNLVRITEELEKQGTSEQGSNPNQLLSNSFRKHNSINKTGSDPVIRT